MSRGIRRAGSGASTIDHVAVVVPARDERERIGATLPSILTAIEALEDACSTQIVVVADRCLDDTAEVAALHLRLPGDRVVLSSAGCVGEARRIGVEFALSEGHEPARTWLAGTDADTIVPGDWLARQLAHARGGATAAVGQVRLRVDPADDVDDDRAVPAFIAERFRSAYTVAGARRPHIHGANLGVRADAYLGVGGWRPIPTGEDHDLWRRLVAAGENVVHDELSIVGTSARRSGRAPNGFAADLAELGSRL